jgi:ribonuclease HI
VDVVKKSDALMALADRLDADSVTASYPGLTREKLGDIIREAAGYFGPGDTVETAPAKKKRAPAPSRKVIIHTDGASRGNPGLAGLGAFIQDEDGQVLGVVSKFAGQTTNNQAEYMAVIEGLKKALDLGASSVELRADSELVVKQINGQYRVKNMELKPRHAEAVGLLKKFEKCVIRYVPREQNKDADRLANEAIDKRPR